jgi:hypothetical protein
MTNASLVSSDVRALSELVRLEGEVSPQGSNGAAWSLLPVRSPINTTCRFARRKLCAM